MNPRKSCPVRGRLTWLAAGAALLCGLAGCAVEPTRPRSAVVVPTQWQEPAASGAIASGARPWWQEFGDAQLNELVQRALSAQPDLRIAAARVAQARAVTEGAEADRLPQLGLGASAQRGRSSAADAKSRVVSAGLAASWDPDLFGRLGLAGQAAQAAQADQRSAEFAHQAARAALAAEVAKTYGEWATLQRRAALARAGADTAQRLMAIARRKVEAGLGAAVEVDRWRAQLASEQALALQRAGEARLRERQLGLLLGTSAVPELRVDAALQSRPAAPALRLPAELVERRPEVQQKARALDAALARLGVARREVYPRLQIDWAGRREHLAVQGAQLAPQWVVGYGVSMSMPLFDGGRIKANVAIHEARAEEAMAEYEKALLAALVDGEMALGSWATTQASAEQWGEAEQAAVAAERNSSRLFDAGMVDAAVVLDAHREVLRTQDARVQAQGALWSAAVGLRLAFAGPLDEATAR